MQLLRRLSFTMLLMSLMTLVACGDGDGDLTGGDDGGGSTPDALTIVLALSNQNVTGKEPITVSATLSGSSTVSGQLVTFSSTLGALSPTVGTALTDANGLAQITLTAGSVRGAGEITASLSAGEDVSIGFTTQGDDIGVVGDINILLTLVDSDGNPTETITSSKSGKVIAQINGISSPVIVAFTTTVGDIPIPTAITNDSHQASVDILANGSLGAGTITASIVSGETGQVLLVVGSSSVTMGSGTPFTENVADISLEQISAGGTTVVTVNIIDDQGNLFTEPVDVNFSSSCSSIGTPTAILSSPITTSNGIATSTYLAKGCVGDDPINVTANAGGINLSATTTVNVLPADVGSIEFISSTPENISILGTGSVGGSESAVVLFRVLDTNSNPVNNQVVNFVLNTDVGGVQLIPASATTNSEGIVQTVVNSGTVATSVRVQATIEDSSPSISSQSSLLVVSTGIPDQDSFSLSASILNPEGWNTDGTEVEITARLADAFNNPVPNGTAVSFTTEGGSVDPSCITANGSCTVIWRSQQPRPEGHVLGDTDNLLHEPEVDNSMGQKYGGRATITATAIGEESFPDLNGNARFDASEMTAFLGTDISGDKYDLKEAFVDHNEDGLYNPTEGGDVNSSGSLEEFVDFDNSGTFDQNDGKYNGVLCSIPTHDGCSLTQTSLNVRRSLVLVMSGSSANFSIDSTIDAVADVDAGLRNDTDSIINIAGENVGSATVIIADLHNQPMPAGTTVTFTATVGSVVGPSSFVWPNDNHNGGLAWGVSIKGESEPKSGSLLIEVETPGGLSTLYSGISIVIK
ncbi:hypothetical protein [Colwellia piezophila]|uniref:hypothetical protein n=1 Tax=Colwellia piezophila TaxID=211668 RepID=UPI0003708AFD|nr:hypothetical protein [Colwellia piezophila]